MAGPVERVCKKLRECAPPRPRNLILNGLRAPPKPARTPCFIQRLSGSKQGTEENGVRHGVARL